VACSLAGADPARAPAGPRRTGVLLAARTALEPTPAVAVPWPESALAARVDGIELHVAHVPNAANGAIKPQTLAALRAGLAERSGPRVLCGDLNTPRREHPDGTVWSFARDGRGRLREARAGFWDESELGVVPGLRDLGFTDAFRVLNGYASREPSWAFKHGGGWRLDHVFCSAELEPRACAYHHEWRLRGLSDHSALEADLAYEPASGP
jgi:exonuclease III